MIPTTQRLVIARLFELVSVHAILGPLLLALHPRKVKPKNPVKSGNMILDRFVNNSEKICDNHEWHIVDIPERSTDALFVSCTIALLNVSGTTVLRVDVTLDFDSLR